MNDCKHDLADMDTAAHFDGLCPLCQQAEIERLRAALRNIMAGHGGECGCAETARAAVTDEMIERAYAFYGSEKLHKTDDWMRGVLEAALEGKP